MSFRTTQWVPLVCILVSGLIFCSAGLSNATPIGTAFTYQGYFVDGDSPANGLYDFQFTVYDANELGSQIGTTIGKPGVDIIDGYFNVALDFGGGIFTGNARWLQIAVRANGAIDYTILTPRQKVTPTPYALYAASGTQGPQGEPGIQGEQGIQGETGLQGEQGIQGLQGETGLQGEQGIQGLQGEQGIQGLQGETGSEGPEGASPFELSGNNAYYLVGNVGLGTSSPTEQLEVDGNIKITSPSGGVIFGDFTKQTTAYIPKGYSIIGNNLTGPIGFSYTGNFFTTGGRKDWSVLAPMSAARRYHAAAAVDGKVYVIGGWTQVPGITNKNQQYDPTTNTWTTKAAMPTARQDLATVALNDKIYAIGGYEGFLSYSVKNEVYDPNTNTWDTTRADMPTGRSALAAVALNGKIYVLGGYDGSSRLAVIEVYDPSTDTWDTTKANMPTGRNSLKAAVANGKIYAIGGYDGSSRLAVIEEYDPGTDTWTAKTDMPTARAGLVTGTINGKIYAIAGDTGSPNWFVKTNEEYDPGTDTWNTDVEDMELLADRVAGTTSNGRIYIIGGGQILGGSNINQEFDPGALPRKYYLHQKN